MKDMGIVHGSAEQAVPLVIGYDTVYVHTDIEPVTEDQNGNPLEGQFRYHEIQYPKLINSALKVSAFVIGLSLLCVAITTLPLFADQIGWTIPEEYSDLFADLVILGAVLAVSCKYILEAFTKFKGILDYKEEAKK